jgi:hypothetical protein
MIPIVLHRSLSLVIACSDGMQWVRGDASHGGKIKAPTFVRGMWLVGLRVLGIGPRLPAGACFAKFNEFNISNAICHRFTGADRHDRAGRRDQCPTRSYSARKPERQTTEELRGTGDARRQEGRTYRQRVRATRAADDRRSRRDPI